MRTTARLASSLIVLPSLVFALALAGCSSGGKGGGEPEPVVTIVDEDRTLGPDETFFEHLIVRTGATLTVTAGFLEVGGDATVEPGGAIVADAGSLVFVVRRHLLLDGRIAAPDHLVIASRPELVPVLDELAAPPPTSRLQPVALPFVAPALEEKPRWRVRGEMIAGADTLSEGVHAPSLFVWTLGDLEITPAEGFSSLPVAVPNGEAGSGESGCAARAWQGGTGGSVYLTASGGVLTLRDVAFQGANGGRGGNASAYQCPNGSVVRAGDGGRPGGFQILAQRFDGQTPAEAGLVLEGDIRFDGWSGGHGGNALVTASNGAAVRAVAGDGEFISRRGIDLEGLEPGAATLSLAIYNGGSGGSATAEGGYGIPGLCDTLSGSAPPSGKGGNAIAEGGAGGAIAHEFVNGPAGVFTGSFHAGHGGFADAKGGDGAPGASCTMQGGRGGDGGNATGTGGAAGVSTMGEDGESGDALQAGGNGAAGGAATADGGIGGDGGTGGCPGGLGGPPGPGTTPGQQGAACP